MKRTIAAITAVAAVLTGAPGAGAPQVKIDAIHMQLFYATSGTLSDDITQMPDGWWNTIIGEGNAKEPADDILVTVVMTSVPEIWDKPVTLTVRDEKHKVLAKRVFPAAFLKHHHAVLPLLLADVGCAGALTAEAAYAGQKKSAQVTMRCGE